MGDQNKRVFRAKTAGRELLCLRLKLVSEDLKHTQVISHDNHALGTAHALARVTAKTGLAIMHQLGASAPRPRWLRCEQDSATLAGSMSRWPVWASAPERASDTTGCSRLARGPWLPARPCLQVPLDCGQGRRAGSWCLWPRSVRTTLVMGGFPVRRGPFGRSEERNGRQGGSACRWPQVFHTQAIRLRPMTLFNPVFNIVTPKGVKRSKTQADEGLTPADEAGYVVLRQPPASKLANLFRIDVRDHALGLVTQQLGGRVTEHPPGGWLGPRTPSLREGPGSASRGPSCHARVKLLTV